MLADPDLTTAQFNRLPTTTTCWRVDFDYVAIEGRGSGGQPLVLVSGIKEWLNLHIELRPRCYQTPPDFWAIEVVGTLPGYGVRGTVDYHVVLPLAGLWGYEGIEIVGATKSERRLLTDEQQSK